MDRVNKVLKAIAMGSIPIAIAFFCILCWHVTKAVDGSTNLLAQADTSLKTLNAPKGILAQADTAMTTINRPCAGKSCGTLALFDKVAVRSDDILTTTQNTVMTGNQSAKLELAMLPTWNTQFTSTLSHADNLIATLDDSTHRVTDATVPTIADTDQAVKDFDTLMTSSDMTGTVHNVDVFTAAFADSAKHSDAILGDIQFKLDAYVHPPKKKLGFWGGILAGAELVHKFEPPIF